MNEQKLFKMLHNLDAMRVTIITEVRKLDWETIAANGFIVDAIYVYRNKFNTTFVDAKKIVDDYVKQL